MGRAENIKNGKDLRQYIEQRTGQQFKNKAIKCPMHADNDPSLKISQDGKTWRCYGACDTGGSIIDFVIAMDNVDFAEAMNIIDPAGAKSNGHSPVPIKDNSELPPWDEEMFGELTSGTDNPVKTKPPKPVTSYNCMADYIKAKYQMDVEPFENLGFHDVEVYGKAHMAIPTSDGIARLRNLSGQGSKYYPDPTNPKVKALKKLREEKKKRKEECLPEDYVQAQWFWLEEAVGRANQEKLGKSIILCNGQTSSVVAQHHGIPAFCKTDGENILPRWLIPELVKLLTDGWKLYVALDCDRDGKGHTVAKKIITQLYQYKPVFIDLSGGRNVPDHYDLADHCIKYGDRSWDMLQTMVAPLPGNVAEQAMDDINIGLREIAKAQVAQKTQSLPELIEAVEARIEVVKSSYKTPEVKRDFVVEAYERFQSAKDNPNVISGMRTGLTSLDYRLGGVEEGVYTFISETGMGKTTLGISIAGRLLSQGPGLITVGEASNTQITQRLVAYLSHVPWKSLKTGYVRVEGVHGDKFVRHTPEQIARIENGFKQVFLWQKQGMLHFRDDTKSLTTASLQIQLRKLVEEYGVKWAIMDSADTIPTPGVTGEYPTITEAMVSFERMAVDNHIPVIAMAQVGRNLKGRKNKVPTVHDALGSNHVEGKSFALMALYNPWALVANGEINESDIDQNRHPEGAASIYLKKSRDDASGSPVDVAYKGGIGFYDLKKEGTQ